MIRKLCTLVLSLVCVTALAQTPDAGNSVAAGMLFREGVSPYSAKKKLPSWLNSDYAPIFNGVNQYAVMATNSSVPNGTEPFSVMFWLKRNNMGSNNNSHFTTGANTLGRMYVYSDASNGSMFFRQGGTANYVYTPIPTLYGSWMHIAYCHPGNAPIASGVIYVDGVAVALSKAGATSTAFVGVNDKWYFSSLNATTYQIGQNLAEISIWNRALSSDEVKRYMPKRLKGTEGMVALYHCNDNGQTLVDSVGAKNLAITGNVPWTARRGYISPDIRAEKYALSFDGVDDLASCTFPDPILGTYPFTIAGWVNVNNASTTAGMTAVWIASTTSANQFAYAGLYSSGGNLIARGLVSNLSAAYSDYTVGSTAAHLGKWFHVAYVCNSATSRSLYLNGVGVATDTTSRAAPVGMLNVSIGGVRTNSSTTYISTKNAGSSLWNIGLTQAQVQNLMYNALTGSETGLVFHVKINEGTGTALDDVGPNNKDMTVTGATWIGRSIP